jgi:hypothetical protein
VSVTNDGSYYYTVLSNGTGDTYIGSRGINSGLYSVSYNPYGVITTGWVSVSANGFIYNPNPSQGFSSAILRATPETFEQVIYGYEGRIFARSSNGVYITEDMGITWSNIFSGLTKCMSISDDLSILYILMQNGDIYRQRRVNLSSSVKTVDVNSTSSAIINFLFPDTYIYSQNEIKLTPGVYNITYGFEIDMENALGNGYNVMFWGITNTNNENNNNNNYFSKSEEFNLIFSNLYTRRTFSNSVVLVEKTYSTYKISAKLLSSFQNGMIHMKNTFLQVQLITNNF